MIRSKVRYLGLPMSDERLILDFAIICVGEGLVSRNRSSKYLEKHDFVSCL